MTKLILFDIGGVITHTDFKQLYTNFATRIGISPEFIIDYHKNNLSDLLLGKQSLDEFWQAMIRAGANPELDFKKAWLEEALKIRNVDTELLQLIDSLRNNYKVGTLTNLTPSRMIIDEAQNIYSHFDENVLSCVEHFKKPDLAFFNLALARFGTEPEKTIFVDDKAEHVRAATDIGIQGIIFTSTESLRHDLQSKNIRV